MIVPFHEHHPGDPIYEHNFDSPNREFHGGIGHWQDPEPQPEQPKRPIGFKRKAAEVNPGPDWMLL